MRIISDYAHCRIGYGRWRLAAPASPTLRLNPPELIAGTMCHDAVIILVVLVVGQFISDPKADEDGDSHTDGQAADIDQRVGFGAGQPAKGGAEMVDEHGCCCGMARLEKCAGIVGDWSERVVRSGWVPGVRFRTAGCAIAVSGLRPGKSQQWRYISLIGGPHSVKVDGPRAAWLHHTPGSPSEGRQLIHSFDQDIG